MALLFFAACASSVNGCGSNTGHPSTLGGSEHTVMISEEFTAHERELVIAGIELWNSGVDGLMKWRLAELSIDAIDANRTRGSRNGRCNEVVVFSRAMSNDVVITERDSKHDAYTLGLTERTPCSFAMTYLVMDRLLTDRDIVVIAAHEFGHAIGLKHTDDPRSLMNPTYHSGVNLGCMSLADADAFCDRFGCVPSLLNYCV